MEANIELQSRMKNNFYALLFSKDSKYNSALLTKEKYDSLIKDIKRIKSTKKKDSSRDYRIIEKYDVVTVQGCEKLIHPISNKVKSIKEYVHADELFEILYWTHLSLGHGGRDKMLKQLNALYKNITQCQIKFFLTVCEHCQPKQKSEKRSNVSKPVTSFHFNFNTRCQVDFIDYQSRPDGKFKFLLVYQDYLTKFLVLKPLTSKEADEVANQLLDIFLVLGAPCILNLENCREFSNRVLEKLKNLWPELKMVHGKPQHNQTQDSVEGTKQDIENMLTTWMADDKSDKWSDVARFVQFMKNRAYNFDIKKSPYEAMFGHPAKVGLTSSAIPQEILHLLNNEEDLEKLIELEKVAKGVDKTEEPSQSQFIGEPVTKCAKENSDAKESQIIPNNIVEAFVNLRELSQSQLTEYLMIKAQLTRNLQEESHSENTELAKDCGNADVAPTRHQPNKESVICVVCSEETSDVHICVQCNSFLHPTCGVEAQSGEEACGEKLLCKICIRNMHQKRLRDTKECLEKQMKIQVVSVSDVSHPIAEEGTPAKIKAPGVDRSTTDSRSVLDLGVIRTADEFCKLPGLEISSCQTALHKCLGHGDLDIVENHLKEEEFSDTEEKPAKRLKTEPPETNATHSTSIQPVKTEPLDKPLSKNTSVRDPSEPPELNHYPAVKEEPLDIPDFVDPSGINSSVPETSRVTVKSEPQDTGGSSSVNFCEVFIPEKTDTSIKQEFELSPDEL